VQPASLQVVRGVVLMAGVELHDLHIGLDVFHSPSTMSVFYFGGIRNLLSMRVGVARVPSLQAHLGTSPLKHMKR
jgi:hypothetical protein